MKPRQSSATSSGRDRSGGDGDRSGGGAEIGCRGERDRSGGGGREGRGSAGGCRNDSGSYYSDLDGNQRGYGNVREKEGSIGSRDGLGGESRGGSMGGLASGDRGSYHALSMDDLDISEHQKRPNADINLNNGISSDTIEINTNNNNGNSDSGVSYAKSSVGSYGGGSSSSVTNNAQNKPLAGKSFREEKALVAGRGTLDPDANNGYGGNGTSNNSNNGNNGHGDSDGVRMTSSSSSNNMTSSSSSSRRDASMAETKGKGGYSCSPGHSVGPEQKVTVCSCGPSPRQPPSSPLFVS